MEPAWAKVNGLKFELVNYRDKKGELRPCYQLTNVTVEKKSFRHRHRYR